MAQADWKRYYCVAFDRTPGFQPAIWRNRSDALKMLDSERRGWEHTPSQPKPIGIVRIRGRKRNPQLQTWLLEHSQ